MSLPWNGNLVKTALSGEPTRWKVAGMRTGAKDAQQVSAVPVRAVLRDRGMRVQLVVASWTGNPPGPSNPVRRSGDRVGGVRAVELAEQVPMVRRGTTGAEAARVIAEYRLSGLVVADDEGVPIAVVPGSQVLSLVLPQYVRDEPNLSHAYDERGADELCRVLNEATIGELLEAKRLTGLKPPSVLPEDTLIEAASAMDSGHTPVILVIDRGGTFFGVITLSRLAGRHRHRGRSGQPAGAAPAGA